MRRPARRRRAARLSGFDYAIVVGFLAVMGLGGFWLSRLIRDADDFFVAGRELTPFILCAAITATNLSMLHVVGMGGTAYQNGVSILWQNLTGAWRWCSAGIFVLPIMRRLRIRSVPEFLQMRYSGPLRVLVAAFWGLRLSVFMGILLYLAATVARDTHRLDNYVALAARSSASSRSSTPRSAARGRWRSWTRCCSSSRSSAA